MKNLFKLWLLCSALQNFSLAYTYRYLFPLNLRHINCPKIDEANWVGIGLNQVKEKGKVVKKRISRSLKAEVSYVWETCGEDDKNCRKSLLRESDINSTEVTKLLPIDKNYEPISEHVVCCHFINIQNHAKGLVAKKTFCSRDNFIIPKVKDSIIIYLELPYGWK